MYTNNHSVLTGDTHAANQTQVTVTKITWSLKAKFHYAIQLASRSQTTSRTS